MRGAFFIYTKSTTLTQQIDEHRTNISLRYLHIKLVLCGYKNKFD